MDFVWLLPVFGVIIFSSSPLLVPKVQGAPETLKCYRCHCKEQEASLSVGPRDWELVARCGQPAISCCFLVLLFCLCQRRVWPDGGTAPGPFVGLCTTGHLRWFGLLWGHRVSLAHVALRPPGCSVRFIFFLASTFLLSVCAGFLLLSPLS